MTKNKVYSLYKKIVEVLKNAFVYRLSVRHRSNKPPFALPAWLFVLLLLVFPQFVLIGLVVALLFGYRVHFERGR